VDKFGANCALLVLLKTGQKEERGGRRREEGERGERWEGAGGTSSLSM